MLHMRNIEISSLRPHPRPRTKKDEGLTYTGLVGNDATKKSTPTGGMKFCLAGAGANQGTVASKARVSATTRSVNFGSRTSAEPSIGWPPSS
jgi:hypothetical protein